MPQLDLSTYPSQIFWLIVCFSCLLWISAKHFLPQLKNILAKRWTLIEGSVEEAHTLQEEAKRLSDTLQHELAFAKAKAHAQILEASKKISKDVNDKILIFSQETEKKLREAEEHSLKKRAAASEQVEGIAEEVIGYLTQALLGSVVSQDVIREAIHTGRPPQVVIHDL